MTCTDYRSVFDCCLQEEALCGIREVSNVQEEQPVHHDPARERETEPDDRSVSDRMVCSACRCPFDSRDDQIEHYKLDWHRFNLRLKMAGLGPVTADEFETKTGTGDMSSISGSESESESEEEEEDRGWTKKSSDVTHTDEEGPSDSVPGRLSSKVVFQNSEGQYLAVYRCALQGKSDDEGDLVAALRDTGSKSVWVVLMTGGGHFAGAVFKGKEVLQHKTFHRYTVRAKRGTAQGLRDAQNRSHAPKSAGAALRRHNEAALVKEIQDLLESWAGHLAEAGRIFLRAPSYNRTMFFGGRAAPLDKKDPRVHTLPFPTRRATFKEIQRVHHVLSTVHVYGKETEVATILSPSKKVWKKAAKPTSPAPDPETNDDGDDDDGSSEEDCGTQLETVEMSLGTLDLREYEIYPSRQRKRRRRKKKEGNKMENEGVNTGDLAQQEGDLAQQGADLAQQGADLAQQGADGAPQAEVNLQEKAQKTKGRRKAPSKKEQPEDGFTLLHVASAAAQNAVILLLMDAGADPACRDSKGQTPYVVAPEKDTRNVFRKYMAEHPEKYDYSKAQVPGPLTAEIQSKKTEKKKAQKVAKKRREKEQKEERKKLELEAEEKRTFAALGDREKRALAAERRLAEQVAATGVNISNIQRCWQCGESLLGKIPFQYLNFSFCSPRCVQAHRKASSAPR